MRQTRNLLYPSGTGGSNPSLSASFPLKVNRWMRHLAASAIAVAGVAASSAWSQQTRAPGEYLVTLAAPAEVRAIADAYGRFGITAIEHLGSNVFLVTLTEDPGPVTMEKLRLENAHIKAVEPNLVYRTQGNSSQRSSGSSPSR